jgi:hypothetical protein
MSSHLAGGRFMLQPGRPVFRRVHPHANDDHAPAGREVIKSHQKSSARRKRLFRPANLRRVLMTSLR